MADNEKDRWETVRELAGRQGGVVSRRQLYAAGLTRWQIKAQLLLGLRACPDDFFDQIEEALRVNGWSAAAAA